MNILNRIKKALGYTTKTVDTPKATITVVDGKASVVKIDSVGTEFTTTTNVKATVKKTENIKHKKTVMFDDDDEEFEDTTQNEVEAGEYYF
ncbi:MAG: hypothetical protein FWG55_08630 [Candidatus Bathyarchaeota archaeon]|nr:hypothetical protein [Candidatus Termiticorpusculum sp.]